ncbi:hypothetical protein ACFY9A_34705 [Streptomyces rubradiris]|uniref:hypothetical protein n=1 Tax=Streptomyces rubradiris TaxID=285531 RepID=UPI0036EF22F0
MGTRPQTKVYGEAIEDFCRICGFDEDRFWEDGWPTAAICDSCGNESGIADFGAEPGSWWGVRGPHQSRGLWLGTGAQWYAPWNKPRAWDLLGQVENIPPKWRTPAPSPIDRARQIGSRSDHASLGTETVCRICGFQGPAFWSDGEPTETVCPCCGTESGIGDLGTPGGHWKLRWIHTRRGYWVGIGAPWAVPEARPAQWDILEQLSGLPAAWR